MAGPNPAVLVLAGPTAVGKSAVALQLAEMWNAEIVSADSRQVYRYLNIGTAKPTQAEQARIPHHLIDICEPDEMYSAARFANDAQRAIEEITARSRRAILVGGTGLYLRALLEGLFEANETTPETRDRADQILSQGGPEGFLAYLHNHDPLTLKRIGDQNPGRLRRAVEFHLQNHESLEEARLARPGTSAPFRFYGVVFVLPRDQLYARVEHRIDAMLAGGWQDEVSDLRSSFDFSLPAFNAVGYRELEHVVSQSLSLQDARNEILTRTRRYAKRQVTWFSHQGRWIWMTPDNEISSKIASGFDDFSEYKTA